MTERRLEQAAGLLRLSATNLRGSPDVLNYQTYTGTSAPTNFNGLVHAILHCAASQPGDIQVNLLRKQRSVQ